MVVGEMRHAGCGVRSRHMMKGMPYDVGMVIAGMPAVYVIKVLVRANNVH
jgi:hypothetical protein